MRTVERPSIKHENDKVVLVIDTKRIQLEAGTSDQINVFRERQPDKSWRYIVLTSNPALNYVGLEVFDYTRAQLGAMFLQEDDKIKSVLGNRGTTLTPINQAKRMYRVLQEGGVL